MANPVVDANAEDSRFRLAMASAGIGMAIVSTEGRFVEVNPALCSLFGYDAPEMIGRRVHEFSHPDDVLLTQQVLERLLDSDNGVVEFEKRYVRADGRVIEVVVNSALMRDAGGQARYFISQLRDVTAQRDAERRMQELNDILELRVQARTAELEAANRRLEAFAYGVSHDLRAPLRTIDGFSAQLARNTEGALDPQAKEHLDRIRSASARMGALIDSLLELSRISRAQLNPVMVDVSLLAEWVIAELQDASPGREVDLQVQPGLEIVGDERLLKVMLSQLLDNAWRFSASRPQVRIDVRGERQGKGLAVSIHDHGIGFDMAYAAKLFEPFQRLHGIEEGAGNGIGLTIAQQIALRHGGRISAQATPQTGATFHVELRDLDKTQVEA